MGCGTHLRSLLLFLREILVLNYQSTVRYDTVRLRFMYEIVHISIKQVMEQLLTVSRHTGLKNY